MAAGGVSGKARNNRALAARGNRKSLRRAREQATYQPCTASAWSESSEKKASLSESQWQESAGSLVLLAAAEASGLVKVLNEAVADSPVPRLVKSQNRTRQQLMLTLLFMNVFEVRRPWDLRYY